MSCFNCNKGIRGIDVPWVFRRLLGRDSMRGASHSASWRSTALCKAQARPTVMAWTLGCRGQFERPQCYCHGSTIAGPCFELSDIVSIVKICKRRDNLIVPRAELRNFEHRFSWFRLVTLIEFHKDQSVFGCRVHTYMGTIRICWIYWIHSSGSGWAFQICSKTKPSAQTHTCAMYIGLERRKKHPQVEVWFRFSF